MKNLKIVSHHQSLASAVAALNPDLSYNPQEAAQKIRMLDENCTRAVVTEQGEIYYVYQADIALLHKFEPFCSCLDDGPFSVAFIVGDLISIAEPSIPKNKVGRAWFKKAGEQFGALAA